MTPGCEDIMARASPSVETSGVYLFTFTESVNRTLVELLNLSATFKQIKTESNKAIKDYWLYNYWNIKTNKKTNKQAKEDNKRKTI